jgi:hypothetical protein
MPYLELISNAAAVTTRFEMLDDRQHLVVPMVMMVEGVHKGSEGAKYYSGLELNKSVTVWNHKPIVVYHPEINGKGVSACDPVILNSRKVGVILNTKYADGKLSAEAWLEVDKTNKVDPRVMASITANKMMEISTGVYVDDVATDGEWNGEKYTSITTNHRGDHLAILPDQKGACSIADGAGLLRNQAANTYSPDQNRYVALLGQAHPTLISNEASFNTIREALYTQLMEYAGKGTKNQPCDCYIEDVYPSFVIYSDGGKLWRLGYSVDKTNAVTLDKDQAEEVARVVEYRTLSGTFVGNQDKGCTMDKTAIVNNLITNGGWTEAQRPFLMGLKDEDLKGIPVMNATKPETGTTKPPEMTTNNAAPVLTQNAAALSNPTMEQWLPTVPAIFRPMVTNALQEQAARVAANIEIITNAKGNMFNAAYLQTLPPEQLQGMVSLINNAAPAPQFMPQQMPILNYAAAPTPFPVTNQGQMTDEAPLMAPVLKFGK